MLNNCRRARGAAYQHGDRRCCLRGTMEVVLDEVESWTKDFKESPVFWLNGLAGTGKLTIAQTIAERAFAGGLLGASLSVRETSRTAVTCISYSLHLPSSWHKNFPAFGLLSFHFSDPIQKLSTSHSTTRWKG